MQVQGTSRIDPTIMKSVMGPDFPSVDLQADDINIAMLSKIKDIAQQNNDAILKGIEGIGNNVDRKA
jgi:hypothetical protein